MEGVSSDPRFRHISKDPRFRRMKRDKRKVKIDDRFKGMFKDKKFTLKYTVDKRGRPINTSTTENLRKYYDLSSEDSDESEEEEESQNLNQNTEDQNTVSRPGTKDKSISKTIKKNTKSMNDKALERPMKSKDTKASKNKKSNNKNSHEQAGSGLNAFLSQRPNRNQTELDAPSDSDGSKSENGEEAESSEQDFESEGEEDVEGSSDEDQSENDVEAEVQQGAVASRSEENSSDDEDSDGVVDYARGKGVMDSSSSDSSSSDDDSDSDLDQDNQEGEIDHDWAELDKEAPVAKDITHRLALCNMDWDRLSAQDILVLLNSFKPAGGVIKSVTVYPSEFGMQRLKEEEMRGPLELVEVREKLKNKNNANDETGEGSEFETEKLRQYQLRRLKYFYAVVECDNAGTANAIYTQCDGVEYEASANRLDIRFIPNDMEFDQEPKSVATEVNLVNYKPMVFFNTALQHSKVECTWDEDDQKRIQVTRRKFTQAELETMDLQQYLASSSESEQEEENPVADMAVESDDNSDNEKDKEQSSIDKYRKLLLEGAAGASARGGDRKKRRGGGAEGQENDEDENMEMEFSWDLGIKNNTEKLVTSKTDQAELTPWEQYLKKKKDKKKQKRKDKKQEQEEKAEGKDGSAEEDNLCSDDDLPSDVDLEDPFFKDVLGDMKNKPSKTKRKESKKKKRHDNEDDEGDKIEQEELGLLMDEDDKKQHFSLQQLLVPEKESKTQKKKRLKREAQQKKQAAVAADHFQMDINDSRFKALYENPLFNIDPSAPEFKKTEVMSTLITEKVKRSEKKRKKPSEKTADSNKKAKKAVLSEQSVEPKEESIDSLVKSVKSKTMILEARKKLKSKG